MADEKEGSGDVCCAVCDQRLNKARFHYGGISCYSCRAFFRRNTQRDELPLCKGDSKCTITAAVRKQCAACRYNKCIRVGMRPELVLDDDEKKTRFRKFLQKKQDDRARADDGSQDRDTSHDEDGSDMQVGEETPRNTGFQSLPPQTTESGRPSSTSILSGPHLSYHQMSMVKDVSTRPGAIKQGSPPTNYLLGPQIQEIKTEAPCPPYTPNQGVYQAYPATTPSPHTPNTPHTPHTPHTPNTPHTPQSPSTFENYNNLTYFNQSGNQFPSYPDVRGGSYSQSGSQSGPFHVPSQKYFMNDPFTASPSCLQSYRGPKFFPSQQQNVIMSTVHVKNEEHNNELGKMSTDILTEDPLISDLDNIEPSIQTSNDLPSTSSKTYQTFLKPKEEIMDVSQVLTFVGEKAKAVPYSRITHYPHEQLLKQYVHKKFEQQTLKSTPLYTDMDYAPNQLNSRKRKSVIVRAGSTSKKDNGQCKFDDDIDNLIDNALTLIPNAGEILKSLGMDSVTPDYHTSEDEDNLKHLVDNFDEKWYEINFGEYVVSEYIRACQNRADFPADFFKLFNFTIRERCLNFVCSLDELEQIPSEQQISLFRRNLDNAEMLTYVFNFNQQSWVEELNFIFGAEDKQQWNARDKSIEGLPLSMMITHMPIPEEDKMELYKNMCSCLLTAITDKTVLVLMLLIVLFDQDRVQEDMGEQVCTAAIRIKANFVTMLMRYLGKKRKASIEIDMNMIDDCIALLPAIAKTFNPNKKIVQNNIHQGLISQHQH